MPLSAAIETYLGLVALGFVVGAFGTLIGAGGGFVLVPVLLLLYPDESPELITSISLAVVFFNAGSGTVAYVRQGRVDFKTGLLFAVATIPGAVLGAITTRYVPRSVFDGLFGVLLVVGGVFLLWRPEARKPEAGKRPRKGSMIRTIVEKDGTTHHYAYDPRVGIALSLGVGFISGLLGLGGGIIHVPLMIQLLGLPVHIATATSHFVLTFIALAGTLVHVATGTFHRGFHRTAALAVGVIIGAQLGAKLSERFHGSWIVRLLAVALILVGVRVFALVF